MCIYLVNTSYSIGLGLFFRHSSIVIFALRPTQTHIPCKAYVNLPLKRRTVAASHLMLCPKNGASYCFFARKPVFHAQCPVHVLVSI